MKCAIGLKLTIPVVPGVTVCPAALCERTLSHTPNEELHVVTRLQKIVNGYTKLAKSLLSIYAHSFSALFV